MTYYSWPWDGPTIALVEHNGIFYDIRDGWGRTNGWSNDMTAIVTEISKEQARNVIELSDEEIKEMYSEEDIDSIEEAVEDCRLA